MIKRLCTYIQYLLPQHLLSAMVGYIADSRVVWLKNFLIINFIKLYKINLAEAEINDPRAYPSFNVFFIRRLKKSARPIDFSTKRIISPADGTIAQVGQITQNKLFQAKHFYFDLNTLLGQDSQLANDFSNGSFLTIYLAPHNYHRVHMPISGKLLKTIYIPGRLFAVNQTSSEFIPNLYSRNERYICVFDTTAGKLIVILVGALIVGSIKTVWMKQPIRGKSPLTKTHQDIFLEKGAELGYFKMGSTVILLGQAGKLNWDTSLKSDTLLEFGVSIGEIIEQF